MAAREKRPKRDRKTRGERMVLTDKDREAFVVALMDPPAPTERLIAAMRRHRDLAALTK